MGPSTERSFVMLLRGSGECNLGPTSTSPKAQKNSFDEQRPGDKQSPGYKQSPVTNKVWLQTKSGYKQSPGTTVEERRFSAA